MPNFRPQVDEQYRRATGGTGLEAIEEVPGVLFQSESRARLIDQGALVQAETWRMTRADLALYTVPANETVLIIEEVATLTDGLIVVEQPAINYGTGEVVVDESAAAAEREAERRAMEEANAKWAEDQLAKAATAPPPPATSDDTGYIPEEPPAFEEGGTSEETLPPGGCETMEFWEYIWEWDEWGPVLYHWSGWEWTPL